MNSRAFNFVVRRLRWLARVPLAPQIFDTFLLTWTALFNRQRFRAIEAVEAATLGWPGVERRVHRLGGMGFAVDGREFAHLHGNGLLDIHVSRRLADQWIEAGRAQPHHVFCRSAWVSVWLRAPEDAPQLLELLEAGRLMSEKRSSDSGPA
ncbi:MAG: luciferase family protein [Chthoniobacteraceae bacterium]